MEPKSSGRTKEPISYSPSSSGQRNITNIEELDGFIEEIASEAFYGHRFAEGDKWLKTRFRKYMIKEYHDLEPVTELVDNGVPGASRINAAIQAGERIYKLRLDAPDAREFASWIMHGLDYIWYTQENKHILPKCLRFRDAQSLGVDEVLDRAERWTAWLQKIAADHEGSNGTNTVQELADGYKWVEVATREALEREGKLMHHCVGSYWSRVEKGKCTIYSLRDANYMPHLTMELSGGHVLQVQGKFNLAPAFEYQHLVVDFIDAMGFKLAPLCNMRDWGFIPYDDKLYRIGDLPKEFWVSSQTEACELLVQAAAEGDIELVYQAMESGLAVSDGWPAESLSKILQSALDSPPVETDLISWLLDLGAKIPSGCLTKAVASGDKEVVRLLLENGADPNEALDYSIRKRDAVTVRILLEHGAVPIKRNWHGECALYLAERVGDHVIKYLLKWAMSTQLYKKVRRMKQRGKWKGSPSATAVLSSSSNQAIPTVVGKQMSLFSSTETGPAPSQV